ncbi:MAG: acyl-CoA dehydrogenase family protein [Steroidobacteraceae bacterium]
MNDNSHMIADTTRRIFRELGNPQSLRTDTDRRLLWSALETAGLTRTWIPEALNGSGATLADGFEVVRIAGEFAISVPLAESLLGGWLLQQAGIPTPLGSGSVAPVDDRDRITAAGNDALSGAARSVPFAADATWIVVLGTREDRAFVGLVDRGLCRIQEHANLAGDARDAVALLDVVPSAMAPAAINLDALLLMGAAVRSMQMAGALQAILDVSVEYANQRVAFEKPIGKFQAIQHSLAKLAGEAAAALAAAGSAADAIASAAQFDEGMFLEVASAKIRVGEAAATGAAIAHQVHGAIGFSQEHVLHRYTQRLWAWRDDFGGESYWAVRLGRMVAANGADALWPMLAAR